jgi:WhiB family transcriptional regulator, redox-sensing transcriptional regulator
MVDVSRLPAPVSETWDWQRRGACRGANSEMFFHPRAERGQAREQRIERAKQICRTCPVIVECRHHALTVYEPYGIWGGRDEGERRAAYAHRRRRQTAVPEYT